MVCWVWKTVLRFDLSVQDGMYPLQEDVHGESVCEEEEEEETRVEEEFDSDESLVDSDSDSDEKGAFITNVQSVPFIHTDLLTCGSSSLSQLTGRSCGPDVWDRDQAETHRWAGEQPAAAPDAEEPVWGETDSAPEQDQRHTAGERPRAAQPQWASASFTSMCENIVSVVCDVFLLFLQGKSRAAWLIVLIWFLNDIHSRDSFKNADFIQ